MARRDSTISAYMTQIVHTIPMETSLPEARRLMTESRVRHLPVMDEGKLVGLLSERDLGRLEGFSWVDLALVSVPDAMVDVPYVVSPETPFIEVLRTMLAHRYGSALVSDQGRLVGIFTTTDALAWLIETLENTSC